jgi:hypothetical protein
MADQCLCTCCCRTPLQTLAASERDLQSRAAALQTDAQRLRELDHVLKARMADVAAEQQVRGFGGGGGRGRSVSSFAWPRTRVFVVDRCLSRVGWHRAPALTTLYFFCGWVPPPPPPTRPGPHCQRLLTLQGDADKRVAAREAGLDAREAALAQREASVAAGLNDLTLHQSSLRDSARVR